ncbi:DUF4369 domain-containing protein [Flavobacterium sp.]|uniref:DUF4369 domain-containing protein n=1 Tax=Flavobacterium sp. TaxID=239 RepID=UPI002B4AF6C1|nr:DUF4369 domain-containing protein [Flavobacterium sp.]HLP63735.1 DUF4369 domain-containing protein [Flavobacterium sp.]
MLKRILLVATIMTLASCSEKKSDKNLEITGFVKGLKKGTLYIQKINDTILVPLDTIKINGDSHFKSEMNIDEPEMFYLFLDRGVSNSLDNNIVFFAEKGKINIETSLDFFTGDAKITGSKNHDLYEEYKKVVSRYVDQNLNLIKEKILAKNDAKKIELIQKKQDDVLKSKYLYTTNFAVNHRDYEVAPYVTLAEIYDINLKYLDTIQKSLSPKVAKSMYGKKLDLLIAERKKMESK